MRFSSEGQSILGTENRLSREAPPAETGPGTACEPRLPEQLSPWHVFVAMTTNPQIDVD